MSQAITHKEAVSAIETARRMKAAVLRQKQSTEQGLSAALTTGTVIAVGGGMAWANERFGDQNADLGGSMREILIPGTKAPADLVGGMGVHVLTFMMGANFKHADLGHNVATALIGGWAVRNGMAMGAEARESAGKTSTAGVPGRTGVGWSPRTGTRA